MDMQEYVVVVAAMSPLQKRGWTATGSLFVEVASGGTAGELSQGATFAERQVKSFVEVVESPYVLQPLIDRRNLDVTPTELDEDVSVEAPIKTSVIEISAGREDAPTGGEGKRGW